MSHSTGTGTRTWHASVLTRATVGRRWFSAAFGAVAVLALLAAIGVAVPDYGVYALAAAVALLITGATVYNPAAIPVLAMPALVVVQRVGGASTNLSFSDFALFGAFWAALLLGPRPWSRPMRSLLWLSAFYQVATLFTVIANPYRANTVEWFHAWLSVGGALVVGWAVGRSGHARLGVGLYLGACGILAAATCVQGLTQLAQGNTAAVFLSWPYGMHKNFVGDVLGIAALVVYARPPWLGLSRKVAYPAFWLFVLAIAATQSRQAIVGLGLLVLVVALRRGQGVRHTKLVLLAIIPAGFFVVQVLVDQLSSGNQFNSAYQRISWYQDALVVWNLNQWFGAGLRWWYSGRTPYSFQPPNAELEVLSSAGTVGLVGFLVLMLGALVVVWRISPAYGTLAFAVIASRLVQGQLDLFWVSVQTSVPFVIAGVCVGALARHEAAPPQPDDGAEREGPPVATDERASASPVAA
ncbi:O-antigen ligase family protein [Luteimicrobium sp. NPDC057192]|uniref:O-antigen ligase family protein n=1 Tax=Luteimicrobium sp. NPDC057192 TaxID=3346042 RepID=UPI00363AF735